MPERAGAAVTDPNRVRAEFAGQQREGQLTRLEGGGLMRLRLEQQLEVGSQGVLQMHDGARFRVTVQDALEAPDEYRLKLLSRERA